MARIGVLASGGGSNLQSIMDSLRSGYIPDSELVVVLSDKEDAYALERAKKYGIPGIFVDPKGSGSRLEYDRLLVAKLREYEVELVLLAGYMRIVTPYFVAAYPNKVMNIHPALLPSFPGLNAQLQAVEYGVKVSGCTVHFVDDEVDHGPIILQAAVKVEEGCERDWLAKKILEQEHKIYPEAVKLYAQGRLQLVGRKVIVKD